MGQGWKKYPLQKSLQQAVKQVDLRKSNIDPLEFTKRTVYLAENIFTFSEAASYKIYKRTQKTLGLSSSRVAKSNYR